MILTFLQAPKGQSREQTSIKLTIVAFIADTKDMKFACLLIFSALVALSAPTSASAADSAKILTDVNAVAYPGGGKTIREVSALRPLTKTPTVLPVLDSVEADGSKWLRVLLPGRPNGITGWIPADKAQVAKSLYSVTVSLKSRTATVTRKGKKLRSFRVVIGATKTPTPKGHFFIEEIVKVGNVMTGPYVLALSARSNVLQEFNGGPGQIGLHGRIGLGDPLGSAASHGCVRFDNKAIAWMAAHTPAGTRVAVK